MDANIAGRRAKEAAEADRKEAIDIARRDREYKATHSIPLGKPIPEELEAARAEVEALPPGRLRDALMHLKRGTASEVRWVAVVSGPEPFRCCVMPSRT